MLKSDSQGFLIGVRRMESGMNTIQADTKEIATTLKELYALIEKRAIKPVKLEETIVYDGHETPSFWVTPQPRRRARQTTDQAESPQVSTSPRQTNSNTTRLRGPDGRFISQNQTQNGLGGISNINVTLPDTDTDGIDPALDAAKEMKDVIAPFLYFGEAIDGVQMLWDRHNEQKISREQKQHNDENEEQMDDLINAVAHSDGGGGGLFGGLLGGLLGGMFGKLRKGVLGKFFKALFKRIPLLGLLFGAGMAAFNWKDLDIEGKGGAIGGIGGGAIGAALGTVVAGPLGTVLGGAIGAMLGQMIGTEVAPHLKDIDVVGGLMDFFYSPIRAFSDWVEKSTGVDMLGLLKTALSPFERFSEGLGKLLDYARHKLTGEPLRYSSDPNSTASTMGRDLMPQSDFLNLTHGGSFSNGELNITERDIVDLAKVATTEVSLGLGGKNFNNQVGGVVDTVLNRVVSKGYKNDIRSVINQRNQFTKINGPEFYTDQKTGKKTPINPYGSVQNMPFNKIDARVMRQVRLHLQRRAAGQLSSVGQHLNYLNPHSSDLKAMKRWGNEVYEQAKKSGMVFGAGKAVHAHGTPMVDRRKMPKPFLVKMPSQTVPMARRSEASKPINKTMKSEELANVTTQMNNSSPVFKTDFPMLPSKSNPTRPIEPRNIVFPKMPVLPPPVQPKIPMQRLDSGGKKDESVNMNYDPIPQNISDRSLAHAVTGGIGMDFFDI